MVRFLSYVFLPMCFRFLSLYFFTYVVRPRRGRETSVLSSPSSVALTSDGERRIAHDKKDVISFPSLFLVYSVLFALECVVGRGRDGGRVS